MSEAMQDRTGSLFPIERQAAETMPPVRIPAQRTYAASVHLTDRDRLLLGWIGEQYTARADLLAVLMARLSSDAEARRRGRVAERVARRRVQGWRAAGLVQSAVFLANTPVTVWLTGDGYRFAGLPWRTYEPTQATTAHRHAVGLVRAEAEAMVLPGAPARTPGDGSGGRGVGGPAPGWEATPGSLRWVCERDLRDGLAGRPTHLPDGVVESVDDTGRLWRTAVEVELSRKTEARVAGILRRLLARYDDVVYHATSSAGAVVERAARGVDGAQDRVHVRPYPPATFVDLA